MTDSRFGEALITGLLCMGYDFVLEPFASRVRNYWVWADGIIPPQNYMAWFVLSGLLAWLFAPNYAVRFPRDARPGTILAATLLIFLAGRF
jgi:putative membrane protein